MVGVEYALGVSLGLSTTPCSQHIGGTSGMTPEQDTGCTTTWGDSDDEFEQVKCLNCEELLVITIIGGVYMESLDNVFLCDSCYCNY